MSNKLHCQHCAYWLGRPGGGDWTRHWPPEGQSQILYLQCPQCGRLTPIELWTGERQVVENPRTFQYEKEPG